jgi:hypothetical protein
MKKQFLLDPLAAAAALAAALLLTPMLAAQSTSQGGGAYQGVSNPPPDDTIQASPDPAPVQAHAKPSPARPSYAQPSPQPTTASATDDPNNPDYGIVTSVPGGAGGGATESRSGSTQPSRDAHLVARPENPDYGIVEMIPSPSNQLAEGTDIRVRLLQNLSTSTTQDGSAFRGQVAADVYKEGRVVIPVGSELRGRVLSVTQGHRLGAPATLRLRPEAVVLPDGTAYHLYAQAIRTDAPGARTDAEGGIQPSSRMTKNLVELGAGSGGGAATGAVIGGPVGAAAGALVGAGIVTAHLLLQHPHQAQVEQGSEVTFSLTEPMDLLPTRN